MIQTLRTPLLSSCLLTFPTLLYLLPLHHTREYSMMERVRALAWKLVGTLGHIHSDAAADVMPIQSNPSIHLSHGLGKHFHPTHCIHGENQLG